VFFARTKNARAYCCLQSLITRTNPRARVHRARALCAHARDDHARTFSARRAVLRATRGTSRDARYFA
jgi:hypothetical protein